MVAAVVDQGNRLGFDALAIEGCRTDTLLDPFGVLDHDPIAALAEAIGDLDKSIRIFSYPFIDLTTGH